MNPISIIRLYVLRALYLLIAVGMGVQIWPGILHAQMDLPHANGVVRALLGALTLLALLGVRYPLKMLPLLFFELIWKAIWVLAIGLPHWCANSLSPEMMETLQGTVMGVVLVPLALPWRYVLTHYIKAAGDRWR